MSVRPERQSGRAMPNVVCVLLLSMREFSGRFAGVGKSLDGMSVTSQVVPDWRKISRAKSAQLTSGPPDR